VIACFVILGMAEGLWVVHIPLVQARLHLSDGSLGAVLLVGPGAVVLMMPVAGWLADRFGSARVARPIGLVVTFLSVILDWARTLSMLLAGLLAFGMAAGLLAVAINAQAVLVERGYRRPLMASFHACYSIGGLSGALLGGILASVRAGPVAVCLAAALPAAVVAAAASRGLVEEPAMVRRGRPGPGPDRRGSAREARSGPSSLRLVALGLLALCCLVSEGTAGNWSGVYLRDNLGSTSGFAVLGFVAFSVTMTGGRLIGDRLAARFGPVRLVRGGGLLAASSLAAGLASNNPVAAVAGFALFGAGLSCAIPQLFSAAGNANPDQPGTGLARVAGLGYVGLVSGPVLIGACAALTGLPVALGIPVLLGLCVAASAGVLDPLRPPGRRAAMAVTGGGAPGPGEPAPR
jgi:MFS family permease